MVALALAVAIVQFLIFDENGLQGYGWIISFVVIACALLLFFKDSSGTQAKLSPTPEAKVPANESSTLNDLLFQLDRVYRGAVFPPSTPDVTSKVIQRDLIFGAINPFAYGLLVLKRSIASPGYLGLPEHAELLSMVVKRMVTSRTQIAGGMATGIPIPGLDLSPDVQAIKSKVLEEVQAAHAAISDGKNVRSIQVATDKLLDLFVASAPYVSTDNLRTKLRSAAAEFATSYLR